MFPFNKTVKDSQVAFYNVFLYVFVISFQKLKLRDVPWKKILTSRTVWSINMAGFSWSLGSKAQRMISFYVDDVLKLNIAEVRRSLSWIQIIILLGNWEMKNECYLFRRIHNQQMHSSGIMSHSDLFINNYFMMVVCKKKN